MIRISALLLLLGASVFFGYSDSTEIEAAAVDPSAFDEIQNLFSASLEKNEIAFISLPFSGVIVRVENAVILFDPANLLSDQELESLKEGGVDLLLYTHGHGDHLHLPTAQKIYENCQPDIAADPDIVDRIKRVVPAEKLIGAKTGESHELGEILVEAVEGKHIGSITLFKVTVGNISLFHGGDSAAVPLENYRSHVAFLPTGAPSPTASPEDAFNMAQDLKPQVAIVMHGSDEQNEEFKTKMNENLPDIQVIIPEIGKIIKISLEK